MAMEVNSNVSSPTAVVGQQFCLPYASEIEVKKKGFSFSPVDYVIADMKGNVLFEVQSKSRSSRSVMFDAAGTPLLTMKHKALTWHVRWRVFRGDSTDPKDLLYSIKKQNYIQFKDKWEVFLRGNTSEEACDFMIKEPFLGGACTIYFGGTNTVAAQMDARSGFFRKKTFQVTVSPNVDYAFISSLIIILSEIHSSRNTSSAQSSISTSSASAF